MPFFPILQVLSPALDVNSPHTTAGLLAKSLRWPAADVHFPRGFQVIRMCRDHQTLFRLVSQELDGFVVDRRIWFGHTKELARE
jgi:hypothetical protein